MINKYKQRSFKSNIIPSSSNLTKLDDNSYLKNKIVSIANFPVKGILFRDITPILADPYAYNLMIDKIIKIIKYNNLKPKFIASPEARGFILGAAVAIKLKIGFIPIRKVGKLPRSIYSVSYLLEYGEERLEIHTDSLQSGDNVVIIDDLIASGGTASSCYDLLIKCSAKVTSLIVLIDIYLKKKKLPTELKLYSVIKYD